MIEWISQSISELTKNLELKEKVIVTAKVIDHISNGIKNPQEIHQDENSITFISELCTNAVADMGCILHKNEKERLKLEELMQSKTNFYEKHFNQMTSELHDQENFMLKGLTTGFEKEKE